MAKFSKWPIEVLQHNISLAQKTIFFIDSNTKIKAFQTHRKFFLVYLFHL